MALTRSASIAVLSGIGLAKPAIIPSRQPGPCSAICRPTARPAGHWCAALRVLYRSAAKRGIRYHRSVLPLNGHGSQRVIGADRMDLTQLRSFVTVAAEGHVTHASEKLHLSQPTISSHIRALEDELEIGRAHV